MISKFAPKRRGGVIPYDQMNKELKLIPGSDEYYADELGNIYRDYKSGFFKMKPHVNQKNGYCYMQITDCNGKVITKRVHRLIAEAWIENPQNLPVVGHDNNIKTDNRVANLYWTTYSDNTQKAVDDHLLVNDKGYDDSQSHPVICYNKDYTEIARYGSVTECHKALGVSKSTIIRHCNGEITGKTRCGYYFRYQSA